MSAFARQICAGALGSVAFLAVRPSTALACAVCFGGQETDWTKAFLAGTAVMLVLPPAILIAGGIAIYRATKRQEARIAERDAALAEGRSVATPTAVATPIRPRHLRSV
ncbi:MAG: hypothetical protein ACKO2K_16400 [Alphaproteobacteria bacterium]